MTSNDFNEQLKLALLAGPLRRLLEWQTVPVYTEIRSTFSSLVGQLLRAELPL